MAQQHIGASSFGIDLQARTVALVSLAVLATLLAVVPAAGAQTLTVLHNFTAGSDGATPAGLTKDQAGNLYGTTEGYGYCNPNSPGSCGSVFKLAHRGSGWILTPLYDFQGGDGGQWPVGAPVLGSDGALYGSAQEGATGYGLVFRLAPLPNICPSVSCSWNEAVVYSFPGGANGADPGSALFFDAAGNIYGTTESGGGSEQCAGGCGTVYELAHGSGGWTESILYAFTGSSDGISPRTGVISDPTGNLYGTAYEGGTYGYGTVFQLAPSGSGWTENTLYDFDNRGSSGYYVGAGLVRDGSGNLYGGTFYGGGSDGLGTIFQLSPSNGSWTLNILYTFTGTAGVGLSASLTMDAVGNLYGTTNADGAYGWGNIFKLTPSGSSWTYTSLYDFTGGDDGSRPNSTVVLDSAGNLYGTTMFGGTNDYGVVWELTP